MFSLKDKVVNISGCGGQMVFDTAQFCPIAKAALGKTNEPSMAGP